MKRIVCAASAVLLACGSTAAVDAENGGAPAPAASGGAFGGGAAGGAKPPAPAPGSQDFCHGAGGIALPGSMSCTADLAAKTFRFAVCSCKDLTFAGAIATSSFDSATQTSSGHGASVGTDGAFGSDASMRIEGSLWAAGKIDLGGAGEVAQELRTGGALSADGSFSIGDDAYVKGAASGGTVAISGALHTAGGAPAAGILAEGGVVAGAVDVASPCDCGKPLAIAPIVQAFASDNDDAASSVAPTTLAGFDGVGLTLACGRYYFDSITGHGLRLTLAGRTAIFVAGDFDVDGASMLSLADGAELDLFVSGNFRVAGANAFGWSDAPARVRVYAGGSSVKLEGSAVLAANLYAPNATVSTDAALSVRGALFANALAVTGSTDIAYDESILVVRGCQAPNAQCTSCHDCPAACNGGTCGACKTDADCCAPLACSGGACVPSIH